MTAIVSGDLRWAFDSDTGASIIELFERIRDEFGTTIVIVTHDDGLAERADRTIRLSDGRVLRLAGSGKHTGTL